MKRLKHHGMKRSAQRPMVMMALAATALMLALPVLGDEPDTTEPRVTDHGLKAKPVDDSRLASMRGQHAPVTQLEADTSIAVILWDERGAGKGGSGKGSQQFGGQSNQQSQSISTRGGR